MRVNCQENDDLFDQLLYSFNKYSQVGKNVLMGDYNSRTSTLIDYVEIDGNINGTDHINLLLETYTNDIKLKSRNNSDKEINEQGKHLIDLYIETKLRILNVRNDGDSLGYRTYYSPRGSSAIDYIICSEDILHDFVFLHVFPPNELSDHSIIWAGFNYNIIDTGSCMNDHSEYDYDLLPGKFNLETGSKTDFITSLEDSNSKNTISQFVLEVNNPAANINVLTDNLNNIIVNAAYKTFHFKQFTKKKGKMKYKQKWFQKRIEQYW